MDDEEYSLRDEILSDMLSSYRPTKAGEEPDEEMTTREVVDLFAETITVSTDTLSCMMKKLGFKLRLRGGVFRWQLSFV